MESQKFIGCNSRLISLVTIQGNDSRMETSSGERQLRDAVVTEVSYGSVNVSEILNSS